MTTPIGPKGPPDPSLGRIVPFPRRPSLDGAAGVGATGAVEHKPTEPSTSTSTSTFERTAGQSTAIAAPVEGAGKSQVLARLQAMGIEGRKRVKTAEPSRVVDGADGRVHNGSLTIESRAGLAKLDGVTRLAGSLALQEGAIKNADLLALRDLKVVEGRLTFEGMRNA
jgi:hypothetical protein